MMNVLSFLFMLAGVIWGASWLWTGVVYSDRMAWCTGCLLVIVSLCLLRERLAFMRFTKWVLEQCNDLHEVIKRVHARRSGVKKDEKSC